MNTRFLKVLLLASLSALPVIATADHDDRDDRRWSGNSIEWRSGRGGDIYFRYPGDRDWRRAPGSAHDVGDGWVIGTDRKNGGYGIYRWTGNNWQRMPGAGVEIGGSYQNPWVINDRGERFAWNGYEWREEWRGNRSGWDRNDRGRDDRRRDGRGYDDDRDDNRRNSWRDGRGR
jgi:hypothetical protein